MDIPIIPIIAAVVVLLLVAFLAFYYRTVPANKAMIVTGAMIKEGIKVVKAGGTFVFPIIQQSQNLSLEVHTINIQTPEVYTEQGVPVMVDGVAQVKVKGDIESILTAAEQFLGKSSEELCNIAQETLEGHLRAILGQMTVEEVYKNRDKFAQDVQNVAVTDLNKMGLQIVSFTIRDVKDKNGYLSALGRPQIAAVVRDAEIAEANAARDEQIAKSRASEEGKKAQFIAETNISEAEKAMEVKKAEFKKEQDMKRADADQAYKLQEAVALQKVKEQEMEIKVIERQKQIEVEEKEIMRREKQYDAEVRKKADADRYMVEQAAEADKARQIREADAHQYRIEAEAKADAERVRLAGIAKADAERVEGLAEAEVIRQKGLAEAEAKDKIAEAMKKYGEAAIAEMIIKQFPDIARAIAEPLSATDKMVIIDSGDGKGANKVTGYVTDLIAQLPETVGALTGVDLTKVLEKLAANDQPKKVEVEVD
ncbi:MAG: SPFH domain-containing protein [Bacillaceae bacterium]